TFVFLRPLGPPTCFKSIQLQRLESPVASPLHSRQKAPRNQGLHRPTILSDPLPLLVVSSSSG
ncbi:hypothetical protein PTB13_16255, partial [Bacillus sp. MHSD17]|nr:hypothetical protein [Bacillus sp. MHSD17]